MIPLIPEAIETYAHDHAGQEDNLLRELARETTEKMAVPQMLSGAFQGHLLYLLAKAIAATHALEIGMFTGYASIWIARGLSKGGKLTCLEIDETCHQMAKKYFDRSEVKDRIAVRMGPALQGLQSVEGPLDFVFLDADKENYCNYYEEVLPRIRNGGLLVADNVLWGGKVTQPLEENDKATQGLIRFNDCVRNDSRVEGILLPIRDGLYVIRKRG